MIADESVLTVREVARYLRMKPLTIYRQVSAGKLPAFKVGSHWRFKKDSIDRWIEIQERSGLNEKTLING